jgi:hypothetical protein
MRKNYFWPEIKKNHRSDWQTFKSHNNSQLGDDDDEMKQTNKQKKLLKNFMYFDDTLFYDYNISSVLKAFFSHTALVLKIQFQVLLTNVFGTFFMSESLIAHSK